MKKDGCLKAAMKSDIFDNFEGLIVGVMLPMMKKVAMQAAMDLL